MIGSGWLAAIGAGGIIFAGLGGWFSGRAAGADQERSKQMKVLQDELMRVGRVQQTIDEYEAQSAKADQERRVEVRYVYREIPSIVEADPVYRNVCVTADGLQLLDRARAAANGISQDPGAPVGGPSRASGSAADGRSQDGTGER